MAWLSALKDNGKAEDMYIILYESDQLNQPQWLAWLNNLCFYMETMLN